MEHLTPAVHLSDPLPTPEPVPNFGCAICAALGRQREEARSRGDMTTVTDSNIEIRRHPHEVTR